MKTETTGQQGKGAAFVSCPHTHSRDLVQTRNTDGPSGENEWVAIAAGGSRRLGAALMSAVEERVSKDLLSAIQGNATYPPVPRWLIAPSMPQPGKFRGGCW
jgi:hypothetical protein